MSGLFDDLIADQAAGAGAGLFDDLIPAAKRELPVGVIASRAGAGRGVVDDPRRLDAASGQSLAKQSMDASIKAAGRADQPFADRREAIDDAVDRIELGAKPDDVFATFEKLGVGRDEIIARGAELGGKAFARDTRPVTVRTGALDGHVTKGDTGWVEGAANLGKRVNARLGQSASSVLYYAGVLDADQAAERLAANDRKISAAQPDEDVQRGMVEVGQAKTFGDAAAALWRNPRATGVMLAESVLMTAPGLAATVARLPKVAMAAGVGANSASIEYGGALTDALSDRGVELSDVQAVSTLLQDDAFMADVRERGAKRGLAVGLVDALTAGIAGRFIEPAKAAIQAGKLAGRDATLAAVKGWAKELGVQVGGGAGGESIAQAAVGEFKPADILLEGVAEGVSAPLEARSNLAESKRLEADAAPGAQFARAFEADTADTSFTRGGVDEFVRASMSPNSAVVDAGLVEPAATVKTIVPRAPRVEDQPTEVMAPEQLAELRQMHNANITASGQYTPEQAQDQVGGAPTEGAGGSQPMPAAIQPPPRQPGDIGVATVPAGSLADRAEQQLKANAQEVAHVSVPDASGPQPGGSGVGRGVDTGRSVVDAGRDAAGLAPRRGDAAGAVAGREQVGTVRDGVAGRDAALTPAATIPVDESGQQPAAAAALAQGQAARGDAPPGGGGAGRAGVELPAGRQADRQGVLDRFIATNQRRVNDWRLVAQRAQRLGDAETARRFSAAAENKQAEIDALESPVDHPAVAGFEPVADRLEQKFGWDVVPYVDHSDGAADGFTDGDTVFVNLANPQHSVAFSAVHELQHVVRRQAERGSARAQNATKLLDQVWGMIDEGHKRSYAEKYLLPDHTYEEVMADPKLADHLRDEVMSDFMAGRADDADFWRGLAKRQPETFGDFVRQWIDTLKELLATLRGSGGSAIKNIDPAIKNLERAKQVAERVFSEWVALNPKLAGAKPAANDDQARTQTSEHDDAPPSGGQQQQSRRRQLATVVDGELQEPEYTSIDQQMSDDVEDVDFRDLPIDDKIVADDHFGADEGELSKAEQAIIEEELSRELGLATLPDSAPVVKFESPADKELKAQGVLAEDAYEPIPYEDVAMRGEDGIAFDRQQQARLKIGGDAWAVWDFRVTANSNGVTFNSHTPYREMTSAVGIGAPWGLGRVSEQAAKDWNRRVAASIDLFRRKFDLLKTVPAPAQKRVMETWRELAARPGAFEFASRARYDRSAPSADKLQQIADSLLEGTRYAATVDQGESPNWWVLSMYDKRTGAAAAGSIEFVPGVDRRFVMHASNFDQGSGLGKPFYQVALAFSHEMGVPTNADKNGLLGVNNYRRTDQSFSAALRAGFSSAVNPGTGQRVYGWDKRAKTDDQHDKNLVRLALAQARNVAEFIPRVRELGYDLASDTFAWRKGEQRGQSAEAWLASKLGQNDVRQVSISRSTVARAAITFQAIDGQVDVPDDLELATPVLYSRRGGFFNAQPGAAERTVFSSRQPDQARAQLNAILGARNRGLQRVNPASVLKADIERAGKALQVAVESIKAGQAPQLEIPLGPMPHVLHMLGAPMQMMAVNTSIVRKVLVDKHAGDFDGITPQQFVEALYKPAMVTQARERDEFELVTTLKNAKGQPLTAVVKVNVMGEPGTGQAGVRTARVMSAYAREVAGGNDSLLERVQAGKAIYAEMDKAHSAFINFWTRFQPSLARGLANRSIKDDLALVKFIGDNYKPSSSPEGWADVPSFSRRTPAPLYVSRKVTNPEAIVEWAKRQGFASVESPADLHVTVAYSREPVAADAAGQGPSNIIVLAGQREVKQLGDEGAVVLRINDPALEKRWQAFRDAGASWDFDGYQPHITVSYDKGSVDLAKVEPYRGPILLGPEVVEPLDDERVSMSTRQGKPGAFELPEFSKTDMTIEAIQDRYNRWKQAVKAVREQGGNVNDINDFYLAEERYWGRVGTRVDDFKAELEAWIEEVAKDGLDLDSIALYAYAEHAPERNAWIASQRPGMPDGGSGMSNQEAADILHDAQVSGLEPALLKHTDRLREFIQGTRDSLYQDGLIDDDEYIHWTSMFQHYVPLRGLEGAPERQGTGQGFNVRGAEGKRALGRYSQAKQIIEQVVQDRVRAYMRAGKNEVGRTFLQFVLDNPSPNLWEVNAVERKPVSKVDAFGNRVIEEETVIVSDDRTVTVKDAGREIHIEVKDERLRHQLQNLHVENVGRVVGSLLWVNRQLSKLYTALSPVFMVLNGARDLQAATVGIIDEVGFMGVPRLYANLPRALWDSYRAEAGGYSPSFDAYRTSGGKTGFFDFKTLDAQAAELQFLLDMEHASVANPRKAWHLAMGLIESLNGGVENATRLAAFNTARESGMSTIEAARVSKNITVNFNRKGTMTPALSAWFLFFNPAVQGTARIAQALRSPKVLGTLGVGMLGMFALALRNAGMGDDDDGVAWWDKIPDEVKERNLVIVLPPGASGGEQVPSSKLGRYLKVPMPYGYNFFAVVANQVADVWRHLQDPRRGRGMVDGTAKAANAFLGAWVPVAELGKAVDNQQTAVLAAVPDALNPIAQVALNVSTFGRKMRPDDQASEAMPDSQKFFAPQAGTIFQKAAAGLNGATGGSAWTPGLVDVAPSTIENVLRGYGGGPVSFGLDVLNAVYARQSLARPEVELHKLPFAKQLYGVIDDETDRLVGHERLDDATKKAGRLELAGKQGGSQAVQEVLREDGKVAGLGDAVQSAREKLSELRKAELVVLADPKLSDVEKYARLQRYNALRRQVLQAFNRAYDASVLATQQQASR